MSETAVSGGVVGVAGTNGARVVAATVCGLGTGVVLGELSVSFNKAQAEESSRSVSSAKKKRRVGMGRNVKRMGTRIK